MPIGLGKVESSGKKEKETKEREEGKSDANFDQLVMEISRAGHCSYGDDINSTGSEYDVFLSFRGPDTRNGITDHLYECMCGAGLRVFRDDEEIRRGEFIGGELQQAIINSRVYAVILSRNYVSSSWCLRELAMMMDLHRGLCAGRKIMLPIFYGVDPCDVKLRTELYRKDLKKHEDRYGHDVVKKWEEALVTIGQISGWDSKAIHGEGRFVRLIVQDILVKLRITDRSLPVHLTGMDGRVSDMLSLLNCDSSGVRLVVLHGMGGIGKTTLASVIYNEISSLFEGSSFLSNVREALTGCGAIAELQNKLMSDVLGVKDTRSCNFDDEVNEIIPRLRGKRMLLILDDVHNTSQLKKLTGNHLDWLGSGSRIIVTTRDLSICNGFVHSGVLYFYEMKKMDDDHALQLFSRHAFGTDGPPEDYVSLSEQVVNATGNLPLVLEVTGGHLCCQSKELWKYTLEKLKRVPPKEVFEILRISYEGLDFREKEIFLDIACFREQMPSNFADHLWEARNLYPKCGVMALINKSLIKVLPNGQFWIHDQLQVMGREIVSSEGLGKCSRVWDPDHALSVVLQKKATEKIIAMDLGRHSRSRCFKADDFEGLSNLLYLQLNGGQFIGDMENLRERLMWLTWYSCLRGWNSTFFEMNNLVVLRISRLRSKDGRVEKLIMPNLRVLEIYDSNKKMTPDVSLCLKLEIIIFRCYDKLQAIHGSMGKLENLTSLNISRCLSLRSLPEELGCARALREIIVTGTGITEVMKSIGRLESLRKLVLVGNKIRKLPKSICYLKSLEELDASFCPLEGGIPEEIGRLSALVNLNLENSQLRQLPTAISQLWSLKSLNLKFCDMLQELPELPASLTKLTFSSSSLQVVPNLSALTNLTELILIDGHGPWNDHGELNGIRSSDCQALELSWIGKLHKLKTLHLCLRGITLVLSMALGSLSRLEKLCLSCQDMASVLQLPSSLTMLKLLDTRSIIPWPYYSNLKFLTKLELVNSMLTDIQLGGLDLLDSLKTLSIENCVKLLRLSNLGSLKRLTSLSFLGCSELVEIPGLEELELLETLTIYCCTSMRIIQDLLDLRRLKRVSISNCWSLLDVPRMVGECNLQVHHFSELPSFEGPYHQYDYHRGRKRGADEIDLEMFP